MKILVPQKNFEHTGIRPLVSKEKALKLVKYLESEIKAPTYSETWNMRYREYMELIKTGNIEEIAKVLKELQYLEQNDKELSFGERKMLDTAQNLVSTELTIALGGRVEIQD